MKRSVLVVAALALWAGAVSAAEPRPLVLQEFEALAHAGKPVVVDVHATWCPTCKAQKPIIERLSRLPAYKGVTILSVDFDTDKAVLKRFKVSMQSTLIAYKNGKEMGRSVGDATPAGIESIFKKAAD